jgi:hypothetical protein
MYLQSNLIALIPAVAVPTWIIPAQVHGTTLAGSNVLQTVYSLSLSDNVPINHRMQDQTRYLAWRRVQRYKSHHILHHRQVYYMRVHKWHQFSTDGNYYKIVLHFKSRSRVLKHGPCTRRQFGYHASPDMISLGGVCVGRGRVPLHGPTIRQRVGPRYRQSWIVRGITWAKVTRQDWVF